MRGEGPATSDGAAPAEHLLRWALRVYPPTRFAVGALGVSAAAILALSLFRGNWKYAIVATFAGFGFAGLALIVARLARQSPAIFLTPAKIVIWTVTLLFAGSLVLLLAGFFIDFFGNGPSSVADPDEVLKFDTENTYGDPSRSVDATSYLGEFGIEVVHKTRGTKVVLVNHLGWYEGKAFLPVSQPNVLTQTGSNDPVSFTLRFPRPLWKLSFTIPPLVAATDSGITYPSWSAQALDAEGSIVALVARDLSGSHIHKDPETYALQVPDRTKACIAFLRLSSDNRHFAAFSAILIDNLALWRWRLDECQRER